MSRTGTPPSATTHAPSATLDAPRRVAGSAVVALAGGGVSFVLFTGYQLAVARGLGAADYGLFDLRYEDIVADPAPALRSLAEFVGVSRDGGWLGASALVVLDRPSRSRDSFAWPPDLVRSIERRSGRYEFLASYSFQE